MDPGKYETFFQRAQAMRLAPAAKARGRRALELLVAAKVAPGETPETVRDRHSPWFQALWQRPAWVVASLLLVLTGSGTGIAWAAERSLPGDTLYPVKTTFNEPLRSSFKTTPAKKAEWETELVDRRIEEMDTLSSESRLDAEKRQILEDQLNDHLSQFEDYEAEGHDSDADGLRERVTESLRSNQRIEYREEEGRLRVKIREKEEREEERRETEVTGAKEESDHEVREGRDEKGNDGEEKRESEIRNRSEEDGKKVETRVEVKKRIEGTKTSTETKSDVKTSSSGSGSPGSRDGNDEEANSSEEETASAVISESEAKGLALSVVSGTAEEAKLGTRDGTKVWEVKIERASDGEEVRAIVNASNGSIMSIDD